MSKNSSVVKKIAEGYGSLLKSAGKIIGLLIICALLGAAFVFPLWKFATTAPKVYTIVVFGLIIATLIFICIKNILSSGIKQFLSTLSKVVIIVGGLVLCINFVLSGNRFLAISTLIVIIILYGIASFGFGKVKVNQNEKK